MPELPEVETTLRGISPYVRGQTISRLIVRQRQLRWPIDNNLEAIVAGQRIETIDRRAKYLLLGLSNGTMLIHLGMSGSLRVLDEGIPPGTHDHFDLVFPGCRLRYRDPRRFGALLWTDASAAEHALIRNLGPEPLDKVFNGEYLYRHSRNKKRSVKSFIMDSRVVVGIGNIYASESLFASGIHPRRACQRISQARYQRLAEEIKRVLKLAIQKGGTSLRDFRREDGKPGYFSQQLRVYGRSGCPCNRCGGEIRQIKIGQRASYYCPRCQR